MNAPQAPHTLLPAVLPALGSILKTGEIYAGIITDAAGVVYPLGLLPDEAPTEASYEAQMAWAEAQGAQLPDQAEAALLKALLGDRFQDEWYWLRTPCGPHSAWAQNFYYGSQGYWSRRGEFRAVAVRRLNPSDL